MTAMERYDTHYLRPPGPEPRYEMAVERQLVAEEEWLYSLYAVDVRVSDGRTGRHVVALPCAVGAASFTAGILLTETDSMRVDAGDTAHVSRLASAVRSMGYRRFRTFPANDLPTYTL